MRQAEVLRNGVIAGFLIEKNPSEYVFLYEDNYFSDKQQVAISLMLPKTQQAFQSSYLFPFFANMLSEGVNRKLQSVQLRIDENDDFGLLLATAQDDVIGAIHIKPVMHG